MTSQFDIAQSPPLEYPELTAYYKRFNDIDWDEIAREKGITGCGGGDNEYLDPELV